MGKDYDFRFSILNMIFWSSLHGGVQEYDVIQAVLQV